MITKVNIPCVWGGHLAGILMKNHPTTGTAKATKKIIGVHGWLDNLNSLLPLAQKLIERRSNYEIYLYDRAGHGFSGHLPKGCDYSVDSNLRDLRIVAQTLGWNKEKFSFVSHSYGAQLSMAYAAAYPEEVSCLVALDSILQGQRASKAYWTTFATRIDNTLHYYSKPPKVHKNELTYEKAIELVRSSRVGIDDQAAKLLVERSIRRDKHNKLHFTRDDSLKNLPMLPLNQSMVEEAIKHIQASVLFIRTVKPQWPISKTSMELLKQYNPNFETAHIDGSHHFHMTHTDDKRSMIITELNIPCIWEGTLTGILLKNDETVMEKFEQPTTKIIGIHGWLDNLNSMLPLAKKLIEHHPNYEIYLYDRAGHGFSSHLPKGIEYSITNSVQDLRTVVQTLGWNKEKFIIIGHSYAAAIATLYAASYPEEVVCLVLIDALLRPEATPDKLFKVFASRVDASLKYHHTPPRTFEVELTFEKALEVTKVTRLDITEEAARLLTERSVRRDSKNKLHFTRDESLKLLSLMPSSDEMVLSASIAIKACVLFIGAVNPQWPRNPKPLDLFKQHNPNFEAIFIDGPHHFHMTHVDEVVERIEQYFDKYLYQPSAINSQL